MLLYLIEHVRPDSANATQELSKVNDGASLAVSHELLYVIKYMVDIKNFGLRFEPSGNKKPER